MNRREVAVEGLPHSRYSDNFGCPECGLCYVDNKKVDVTYYLLPTPDTIAGTKPKDGAIEVHCECGQIFWNHVSLDVAIPSRDVVVAPEELKVVVDKNGRVRGTFCQDGCDFTECDYNLRKLCCFGGWNMGLGCRLDLPDEEFNHVVQVVTHSRLAALGVIQPIPPSPRLKKIIRLAIRYSVSSGKDSEFAKLSKVDQSLVMFYSSRMHDELTYPSKDIKEVVEEWKKENKHD